MITKIQKQAKCKKSASVKTEPTVLTSKEKKGIQTWAGFSPPHMVLVSDCRTMWMLLNRKGQIQVQRLLCQTWPPPYSSVMPLVAK